MMGQQLRSATAVLSICWSHVPRLNERFRRASPSFQCRPITRLKFLPNADAAMLQLLGKKMPGFMRADVAMRDAFDDLRAHLKLVSLGTRAALTEVLGKA